MKYYLFEIHVTVSVPYANYHYYFDILKTYTNTVSFEEISKDVKIAISESVENSLDRCPCPSIEDTDVGVEIKRITQEKYFNMAKG